MKYSSCVPSFLLALLVFSGCNQVSKAAPVQTKAILEAHAAVSDQLRDPGSAQFRHDRLVGDGKFVCGEVNSRNGYGGYAGFTSYIFYVATRQATISEGPPNFAALVSYHGSVASQTSKKNIDQVADACSFQIEWMNRCESHSANWAEYKKVCENFLAMRPKVDSLPTE